MQIYTRNKGKGIKEIYKSSKTIGSKYTRAHTTN